VSAEIFFSYSLGRPGLYSASRLCLPPQSDRTLDDVSFVDLMESQTHITARESLLPTEFANSIDDRRSSSHSECTRLEKDRDGCPKIVNLGASRTDAHYERQKLG